MAIQREPLTQVTLLDIYLTLATNPVAYVKLRGDVNELPKGCPFRFYWVMWNNFQVRY